MNKLSNKRTFNFRDDDTLYECMRVYNNVQSELGKFYSEMTENYDFTIGKHQWSEQEREALEKDGRAVFSYNLIRTILNVIYSVEKDNRKTPKVNPRTGDDMQLAKVVNETLRYYLSKSGFERARGRVFRDALIARLGVFHVNWVYQGGEDDLGHLKIQAVDPRELAWEDNYNDTLWENSSFIFRKYGLNVEEILNTFALRDTELALAIQEEAQKFFSDDGKRGKWISRKFKQLLSAVYDVTLNNSHNRQYDQWWNSSNGKFDVLEMHEKRTERRITVRDINQNRLIDITDAYLSEYKSLNDGKEFLGFKYENEIIDRIKDRYSLQGDVDTNLMQRRFVTTVVPALYLKVNEQPYPFDSKYYMYIPQYCYDVHASLTKAQSLIDDIKDPQRDFNKARSLILELLARYSNKGYILDEDAISGVEEDWTSNKIVPFKRVRSGYFGLIKPEEGFNISPELIRMPFETQQLLKVITNADDEIRGTKAPGVTSGRHFIAKEERQAKSFTTILEHRDETLKAVSEMSLNFIQHFVTTQTVIRITRQAPTGESIPQEIQLNKREFITNEQGLVEERVINDLDAYKYDIEVTDEPFSATAQESKYKKLGDIFNAILAVNKEKADAILPIMVESSGVPDAEKILTAWETQRQANPQQEQMAQLMQQLQMIIAKLGVEEKKAEIESIQLDNLGKAQALRQAQATPQIPILNNEQNTQQTPNIFSTLINNRGVR